MLTYGPGAGFEGEIHSSVGEGHYLQAASVDGKLCAKPLPNIVAGCFTKRKFIKI
jgi:hypothetical protein